MVVVDIFVATERHPHCMPLNIFPPDGKSISTFEIILSSQGKGKTENRAACSLKTDKRCC